MPELDWTRVETARSSNSSQKGRFRKRRGSGSTEGRKLRTGPRPSFKWDELEQVTVSDVTAQRRSIERVNVYLDGSFAFSISALLAAELKLRKGAVLATEALRDLLARDEVVKAVEACVRLLSYRPRSEAELSRRLAEKGYDESVRAQALARLHDLGYVDDAEFARFWVENRERFKPMGVRRLKSELMQKGVSRDTADQAMEDITEADEDDTALKLARSRLSRYAGLEYPVFSRRLGGFLARQGFGFGTSARVVRALWAELNGESVED